MKVLKKLRKEMNVTQSELSSILGVSPSTIGMYEQGRREPDKETLLKIANFFHVSTDYLLGHEDVQATPTRDYIKRIPVLGSIRAGIPIEAIEDIEDWEEIDTRQSPFRSGEFFALRVTGDSMLPTLQDGDIVVVRQQPRVENGEIGIVMVNGDNATVKEVKESPQGITLIGHNAAVYTPHFYDREEVESLPLRVIGKVVELRRKF